MIVIEPIPGQEEENAKFISEHGAGFWIKHHDNVEEKLNIILNSPDLLKNMQENAKSLAKKNSTKNICEILLGNIN